MTAKQKRTTRRRCDTCGHTTPLTTDGQADWAMRRHSCATNLERKARRQRRLDRENAEGPVRPCLHKQANHQHGDYATYVHDRCRCRPCRIANSQYEQTRTKAQLYGRWNGYVNAQPARDHIQSLIDQGMGLKRITAVSDVSHGALWKLMYGKRKPDGSMTPSRRITPSLEQRILVVELDLAGGAKIPSVGTARRIQALVACGWSMSKISARLGIGRSNFTPVANGTRGVTASTARAVIALYDELWNTAPPQAEWRDKIAYSRAKNHAARLGWAPPLAWDDDTIDDPTATPDLGAKPRNTGGRPHALNVEDIEFLLQDQPLATTHQLAERLHVSRDAIQQACRRAGRTDLLERLARNAELKGAAA